MKLALNGTARAIAIMICLLCTGGRSVCAAQPAGLVFSASFDGNTTAVTAEGSRAATRVVGNARYEKGIRGQALVAGDAGAWLTYQTKGNVVPQRGTVEMWVKPVDWSAGDEGFHIFFSNSDASNGWLQLYKYTSANGALMMLVGKGSTAPHKDYEYASQTSNTVLNKGEWAHLVGTWDGATISLYVNGEPFAAVSTTVGAPVDLGGEFTIGDSGWGKPRRACTTLIDEVRIYSRVLSPSEVKEEYRSYQAEVQPALGPHRLMVVKTVKAPAIDGKLTGTDWSEPEWNSAAAVTGFIDTRTGKLADRQATAYLTYDDDRVYFAFNSEMGQGAKPVANVTARDGQVWSDEAVEFVISPPADPSDKNPVFYQFVGNSAGVFYDGKGFDGSWNGAWQYAASTLGRSWSAEGSIRWADLGHSAPKDGDVWRVNLARDWQNPQAWTLWGHAKSFQDIPQASYVTFRERGTVARVENLGRFTSGNVDFSVPLTNLRGAAPDEIVGTLTIGKSSTVSTATVPPGGKSKLEFKTRIADPDAKMLSLRIESKTTGDVLWEGDIPFDRTNPVTSELVPLPSQNKLEIRVDISGLSDHPVAPKAVVEFAPKAGGGKAVRLACAPFDDRGYSLTGMPLDSLPPGRYDVAVKVLDGDKTLSEVKSTFDRRDEPWLGNKIGITDKILPGWTPIKMSGKTLKCWGREMVFENSLFPSQIVSRGSRMLASAIRLEAKIGGKLAVLKGISFKINKATPARVDFTTSASLPGLRVVVESYLEYDGMLFFKTRLVPTGPSVKLDSLALIIPMRGQNALLWHCMSGGLGANGIDNGGYLPSGQGVIWQRAFRPFIWLGDYDRGITWFAEDSASWNISNSGQVLQLVRGAHALDCRVNFADAPMLVDRPRTIAFGLQATPVKPMPKGWRMLSMASSQGQSPGIVWTSPQTTTYFGYPQAADPSYIKRMTDDFHSRGVRAIPYMHPTRLGENSPEWQFYGRDWALPGVVDSYSSDVLDFGAPIMGACPSVPAFRDWMAWKNSSYLKSTGYDGLYYDHSWPYNCFHTDHSHAPGAWPLLGYREMYRRLYTLCKERNPNDLVATHVSGGLCSMYISWSDITIPGEELSSAMEVVRGRPETKDTTDLLDAIDLDYYESFCMGRQFGMAPILLPPVWCVPQHLNAMMLLTDSIGAWRYDSRIIQVYSDLGMGADDVEFLPYWSSGKLFSAVFPDAPAGVQGDKYPRPLVSAYRRPGRFVLFAVANLTKSPRKVRVRFDPTAMGVKLGEYALTDAYPRYPLVKAAGTFEVDVAARSYRVILLTKVKTGAAVLPSTGAIPGGDPVMIVGTGRVRGDGTALLSAGTVRADTKAVEQKAAQTFTLTRTTKVDEIRLERAEKKFKRAGLPCDLRVYKANADGSPTGDPSKPLAWAWTESSPGYADYRQWVFKKSMRLAAGRYVFVLSEPSAASVDGHFYSFALWEASRLPGETALAWDGSIGKWEKRDGVLSFGVYGYQE